MADLFDQTILCSECGKKMQKVLLVKNGFKIRALRCEKCHKIIQHPSDLEEYKRFMNLKQRPFAVKLRMVGNSYTVSIPREIIDFHREQEQVRREQEQVHQRMAKIQDEMIRMFLEDVGRISLCFTGAREEHEPKDEQLQEESGNEEYNHPKVNTSKKIKLRK